MLHAGVYESELERTGNVYMLRDEPPHRLHALTTQAIMATGVVGFESIESVPRILQVRGWCALYKAASCEWWGLISCTAWATG